MNDTHMHKTTQSKGNHHKIEADLDGLYESGEKIKAGLQEGYEEAKKTLGAKASELKEQMREQGSAIQQKVDKYVNEKPYTALGIAALVGLAFGLLLRK
ncbi:MAG: hypothetical protein WBE18_07925 [Gammaproteobacteria bacterium]